MICNHEAPGSNPGPSTIYWIHQNSPVSGHFGIYNSWPIASVLSSGLDRRALSCPAGSSILNIGYLDNSMVLSVEPDR